MGIKDLQSADDLRGVVGAPLDLYRWMVNPDTVYVIGVIG
jgi:hypothetical protein